MKKLLLHILLTVIPAGLVYSQEGGSASQRKISPDSYEIHKVLIVPFPRRMYNSEITQEILDASKITGPQLVDRFRSALSISLRQHMPGWWESQIMVDNIDNTLHDELIDVSVKYKFELYDEKTGGAKKDLMGKEKKFEKKPGIQKGQIHTERDDRPKFMNITLKSDTLLRYLSRQYAADYFLFINQLDISSDLTDYADVANKTYIRNINVHYTIFDREGKQFFAGLAKSPFQGNVNDAETIIGKYFGKAAATVTSHLPPPVKVKTVYK